MNKQKPEISVREILAKLGDGFDTGRIYHLVYDMFRPKGKHEHTPERLFGKGFKSFDRVPNNKQARLLVWNLLMLRALHVTREQIIGHLTEDTAGTGSAGSILKESSDFYRVQHVAANFVLDNLPVLKRAMDKHGLKHFLLTPHFPKESSKPAAPAGSAAHPLPLSPIPALVHLDAMLEARHDKMADSPDAQAECACNLFELGCYVEAQRMVDDILKKNPWHGMANYVGAMLHTAEAHLHKRIAGEKAFQAEVATSESGFASDALAEEAQDNEGELIYRRHQALVQFVIALKHWPRHQGYFDHSRRRTQVLGFTLARLALLAHEKGKGKGLGLHEFLSTAPAGGKDRPDLDRWVLDIMKEEEPSPYAGDLVQRAVDDLSWLQFYWVLDDAEYRRFSQEWLKRLDSYIQPELEAIAYHPALLEHLARLVPDMQDRRSYLSKFEERCHEGVTRRWNSVRTRAVTEELCACYKRGEVEAALSYAKERVAMPEADPRFLAASPSIAVYDHIRILYDLSVAALKNDDPIAASRWLCQLVAEYPDLRSELGELGHKAYLHDLGEYGDYFEDTFGNDWDIFGDRNTNAPDESAPLTKLVRRLLGDARVGEPEKEPLRLLLAQLMDDDLTKGGGAMA